MSNQVIFNTAKEKHLKKLSQYVPVVSGFMGAVIRNFTRCEVFENRRKSKKRHRKPNLDVRLQSFVKLLTDIRFPTMYAKAMRRYIICLRKWTDISLR